MAEDLEKEFGVRAIGVHADLTSQDDVENVVRETLKTFGEVHILANVAEMCIRDRSRSRQTALQTVWT